MKDGVPVRSGKAANAASVALISGGTVLLIRRAYSPYQGLWTLPGGRMVAGETAEECAAREVKEELGLAVAELRLVEMLSQEPWRLAVFASTVFAGAITPSAEVAEHRWLEPAEVSRLESTPGLAAVLARAFPRKPNEEEPKW